MYAQRNVLLVAGGIAQGRRDYHKLMKLLQRAKFHRHISRFTVVIAGSGGKSRIKIMEEFTKAFPDKGDAVTRVDFVTHSTNQVFAALHQVAKMLFLCLNYNSNHAYFISKTTGAINFAISN